MMRETKDFTTDDWDIFPFNQKEDGQRWARLIDEMDELSEKNDEIEAVFGGPLTDDVFLEHISTPDLFSEKTQNKI